jgi:hypothetical protein
MMLTRKCSPQYSWNFSVRETSGFVLRFGQAPYSSIPWLSPLDEALTDERIASGSVSEYYFSKRNRDSGLPLWSSSTSFGVNIN